MSQREDPTRCNEADLARPAPPLRARRAGPGRLAGTVILLALVWGAFGCDSDGPPACIPLESNGGSAATPSPTVEAPPPVGVPFIQATDFDLADVGYQQTEFFISGTALSFTSATPLSGDGDWTTQYGVSAPYRTRIVVHRPIDPADFSGTVFVEWLNVSGGLDAAPGWTAGHVELIRQGHAWVGVSAQLVGVEGGGGIFGDLDLSLKAVNPDRYGTLSHPTDSYSYDIFSQAGQAVRAPVGLDPLGGLVPERVIATGESQSAFRLVTYVNGVDPFAQVFDGFIIHSRLGGAAPLAQTDPSEDPPVLTLIEPPATVRIRSDARVPVLVFQTETDLFAFGSLGAFEDRQPDAHGFRLWEVAGSAHADNYTLSVGASDQGDTIAAATVTEVTDPIPNIIECPVAVNSSPSHHYVYKAAVRAMNDWVACGEPPPSADRLSTSGMPADFDLDANGNVLGGIRTPWVDAPVAQLSGEGQTGLCALFGSTRLFDPGELAALYTSQADYEARVQASLDAAIAAGFILEEDRAVIEAAAAATSVIAAP